MSPYWATVDAEGQELPRVEYLGCYRASDALGETPRDAVTLGGWAYRGAPPALRWRVALGQVEGELLLGRTEEEFLAQCVDHNLCCWAVGRPMLGRALMPTAFHVSAVLPPEGAAAGTARPHITNYVAEALCRAALYEAQHALRLLPEQPRALALLGSELRDPEIAAAHDAELIGGVLFAAHAEMLTVAGMDTHQGEDATRLGASNYSYNLQTKTLRRDVPPRRLPAEPLRGCLLVDRQPARLLAVARMLLAATPAPLRSLVLCSREDLAFVAVALEESSTESRSLHVAPNAAALDAAAFNEAPVVLTTLEVLECLAAVRKLEAIAWHRLVSVGWPAVSWRLCRVVLGTLRYTTHLALTTTELLQEHAPQVAIDTVGHLLGLSAASLNEPLALASALAGRVLHLDATPNVPTTVLGYRVALAPLPEQELRDLEAYRGAKRARRRLFATLCGASASAFPELRDATPSAHFARLGGRVSDFAVAALAAEPEAGQDCPICFEELPPVVTRCGHRYCEECLQQALARRRSCPACREPLQPSRDVVVLRPPTTASGPGVVMQRLQRMLGESPPRCRTLVVSSHGDLHEKLAAWLRRQGRPRTWAWRGNTQQLVGALGRYQAHPDATLLVDPAALPLDWACFEQVDRVLVLWPLQRSPSCDPCCQLRRLYGTLAGGPGACQTTLLAADAVHDPATLRTLSEGCEACHRHGAVTLAPAAATLASD